MKNEMSSNERSMIGNLMTSGEYSKSLLVVKLCGRHSAFHEALIGYMRWRREKGFSLGNASDARETLFQLNS